MKALMITVLTLGLATSALAGRVPNSTLGDSGNGAGIQLNWCNGHAEAGDTAVVCIATAKDLAIVVANGTFHELSHSTTGSDRLTCFGASVDHTGPLNATFAWGGTAVDWAAESACYQGGTDLTALMARSPAYDAFVDASGKLIEMQHYGQPFLIGITDVSGITIFGSRSVNFATLPVSQSP